MRFPFVSLKKNTLVIQDLWVWFCLSPLMFSLAESGWSVSRAENLQTVTSRWQGATIKEMSARFGCLEEVRVTLDPKFNVVGSSLERWHRILEPSLPEATLAFARRFLFLHEANSQSPLFNFPLPGHPSSIQNTQGQVNISGTITKSPPSSVLLSLSKHVGVSFFYKNSKMVFPFYKWQIFYSALNWS